MPTIPPNSYQVRIVGPTNVEWDPATGIPVLSLPVSATATHANVASSATVVTLQALNVLRLGWTVFNDSSAILYVKCGSGASATSYTVQIAAGGYWELPFRYSGIVTGIWASANGNARVVEFS